MYVFTPKRVVVYDRDGSLRFFEGGYNRYISRGGSFIYDGRIHTNYYRPIMTNWGLYLEKDGKKYFFPPENIGVLAVSNGFLVLPNNPVGKLIEQNMIDTGTIRGNTIQVPVKILYGSGASIVLETDKYIISVYKDDAKIFPRHLMVDEVWKASAYDVVEYLTSGKEKFTRKWGVTIQSAPYVLSKLYYPVFPAKFFEKKDLLEEYLNSREAFALVEGSRGARQVLLYKDFELEIGPSRISNNRTEAYVWHNKEMVSFWFRSGNCNGSSARSLFVSCLWNNPISYGEVLTSPDMPKMANSSMTIGIEEELYGYFMKQYNNCIFTGVRIPTSAGIYELKCKHMNDGIVLGIFKNDGLVQKIADFDDDKNVEVEFISKQLEDRNVSYVKNAQSLLEKVLTGVIKIKIDNEAMFEIQVDRGKVVDNSVSEEIRVYQEFKTI